MKDRDFFYSIQGGWFSFFFMCVSLLVILYITRYVRCSVFEEKEAEPADITTAWLVEYAGGVCHVNDRR
jgi:hypothetical protein